jgi:hypothetical protein
VDRGIVHLIFAGADLQSRGQTHADRFSLSTARLNDGVEDKEFGECGKS